MLGYERREYIHWSNSRFRRKNPFFSWSWNTGYSRVCGIFLNQSTCILWTWEMKFVHRGCFGSMRFLANFGGYSIPTQPSSILPYIISQTYFLWVLDSARASFFTDTDHFFTDRSSKKPFATLRFSSLGTLSLLFVDDLVLLVSSGRSLRQNSSLLKVKRQEWELVLPIWNQGKGWSVYFKSRLAAPSRKADMSWDLVHE